MPGTIRLPGRLVVYALLWVVIAFIATLPGWRSAPHSKGPSSVICAVTATVLTTLFAAVLELGVRRYRPPPSYTGCPHCEYDRTGLEPDAACPECGKPRFLHNQGNSRSL